MAMSIELRHQAVERYYNSMGQAEWQERWARITGKTRALLKYEDVANRLHIRQQIPLGLRMIRLEQIVGSVGRYREFTNTFLPRASVLLDRWVAVDITMNSLQGLPPIELYKIGEGYFVIDGNHRISVAHANGNKDIEASVIECQTSLHSTVGDFTVDDFMDDRWLIKVAYSEFLAQTQLDQLRPEQRLNVTTPEHYQTLLQHIAVHRYLTNQSAHSPWGTRDGRILSWEEAVVSWYDRVYMPIVEAIRTHKIKAHFPKRTEADLYVWIAQYRERVAEEYGLAPLDPAIAATVFAANHSERLLRSFFLALQHNMRHRLPILHRGAEGIKIPPGITEEVFYALRLRHDAGELSLTEARRKQTHEAFFGDSIRESHLGIQFSA